MMADVSETDVEDGVGGSDAAVMAGWVVRRGKVRGMVLLAQAMIARSFSKRAYFVTVW